MIENSVISQTENYVVKAGDTSLGQISVVSVSQNTETGGYNINIGAETFVVADHKELENKAELQSGLNKFNANSDYIVTGKYINYSDGKIYDNLNYSISPYIPIRMNKPYYLSADNDVAVAILSTAMAFYDNNFNYISKIQTNKTFTSPNNACFVRFSFLNSFIDSIQLEEGLKRTHFKGYEEYGGTLFRIPNINIFSINDVLYDISGRFEEIDNKLFNSPIMEKGYYTNSFHVDVDSRLPAYRKLELEGPFHLYANGGCISYVELAEAPLGNAEGLDELVEVAIKSGVHYLGFNFPKDVCKVCGAAGTFDICPECGSKEITRIRRVSGYLEIQDYFTKVKMHESKNLKEN